MSDKDHRTQEEGEVKTKDRVKKPRMYKVLLHNDDYTTMEFVITILQQIFRHSMGSAVRVMLHVHRKGVGVAGVYTREVAETRVDQALQVSRESGHPLQCTMEPE